MTQCHRIKIVRRLDPVKLNAGSGFDGYASYSGNRISVTVSTTD